MIIKSLKNPYIKDLKKQMLKKSLLFLDNPKLVEEALEAKLCLHSILVDIEKFDKLKKFDFIKKKTSQIVFVDSNIIRHFAKVQSPQGAIGIFEVMKIELKIPTGNFLVLDSIQDAGNVGMLIRSALGAEFKDVYLINCAKVLSAKTIRSSMGSVFKLNYYEITKEDFLNLYKKNSYPLYRADLNGKNVFNFKFQTPCGIVLGNEGHGICTEIKNITNDIVSIPLSKNLESLNVGVAGSIIMFQIKNLN